MKEIKEMESLKVDTGSEGEILQNDIIDFVILNEREESLFFTRIKCFN